MTAAALCCQHHTLRSTLMFLQVLGRKLLYNFIIFHKRVHKNTNIITVYCKSFESSPLRNYRYRIYGSCFHIYFPTLFIECIKYNWNQQTESYFTICTYIYKLIRILEMGKGERTDVRREGERNFRNRIAYTIPYCL